MAQTNFTDKQLYKNFSISRETFQYIVSEVEHELLRQDTRFRKAVCPSTKIAILLYFLGSTAEYRNLFGISKPFVSLCITDVAQAIVRRLKASFLIVPKGEDVKDAMSIYREKWGFPTCAGAIDETHVPIQGPLHNPTDYVNRKSYHSVVTQAFVDGRYLFQDIVVGWPGSVHESMMLEFSQTRNLITGDSHNKGYYLTTVSK